MLEIMDIKFDEKTGRISSMKGRFVLPAAIARRNPVVKEVRQHS